MRLSDAGLRRRQSKLIYFYHRSTPSFNKASTRERSNRLLADTMSRRKLDPKIEADPQNANEHCQKHDSPKNFVRGIVHLIAMTITHRVKARRSPMYQDYERTVENYEEDGLNQRRSE
jgi:hypothetical protein